MHLVIVIAVWNILRVGWVYLEDFLDVFIPLLYKRCLSSCIAFTFCSFAVARFIPLR